MIGKIVFGLAVYWWVFLVLAGVSWTGCILLDPAPAGWEGLVSLLRFWWIFLIPGGLGTIFRILLSGANFG